MSNRSRLVWALGSGIALAAFETLWIASAWNTPDIAMLDLVLLLAWLAIPYGAGIWVVAHAGSILVPMLIRTSSKTGAFAATASGVCLLTLLREVMWLRQGTSTYLVQEMLLAFISASAGACVGVMAQRCAVRAASRGGGGTPRIVVSLATGLGLLWAGAAAFDFAGLILPKHAPQRTATRSAAVVELGRPNIILISIDTLRADHVSCYGYARRTTPNIDALAADGVRFTHASSTGAFTVPAHASMMTGLFPSSHGATYQHEDPKSFGIRAMSGSYQTLAEILSAQGYDTAGFVSCALAGRTFGFSRGFDTFDDQVDRLQSARALLLSSTQLFRLLEWAGVFSDRDLDAERHADEITPLAQAWVSSRGAGAKPFFLFVHYYDPHAPYSPPAPYDQRTDGTTIPGVFSGATLLRGEYTLTASALQDTLALYDGEIQFTDRYVGNLLKTLKYNGSLANAIVILTSDHGESFGEHQHWAHTRVLYEDVLHVPFIMMLPGRAAAGTVINDVLAQPTDILPTVLSLAGLKSKGAVEGRDLTPFISRSPASITPPGGFAFAEQVHDSDSVRRYGKRWDRDLLSARTERWKYIRASNGVEELYNLQDDSGETRNLVGFEPPELIVMRNLIKTWQLSLRQLDLSGSYLQIDAGTKQNLRSLGYVQ